MATVRRAAWRACAVIFVGGSVLGACAMPGQVQRIGVEYNTAIGGMANELTLLNIVRAKEDMPLHYTAVNRISGSITVKGTTSFGQLKDTAKTVTSTHKTTKPPTVDATVEDTLADQTVKGGNGVYPSIGGEISTGPSFEIGVLDGQKFYQGILAPIPFKTIENFASQGYDNQLLIRLLIEKVDITLAKDTPGVGLAGTHLYTLHNAASGSEAEAFAATMACYVLTGGVKTRPASALAPLSRVTRTADGKVQPLKLEDLQKFDGKTLALDKAASPDLPQIGADGAVDDRLLIWRPAQDEAVARLDYIGPDADAPDGSPARNRQCLETYAIADTGHAKSVTRSAKLPQAPPADPYLLTGGKLLILEYRPAQGGPKWGDQRVDVTLETTFRSPESVIRFVGRYLKATETSGAQTYQLGMQPLFSVKTGRVSGAVVSTDLLHKTYAIADDKDRPENMMIIALIQQLVNLHKEASERPASVPVYTLQ